MKTMSEYKMLADASRSAGEIIGRLWQIASSTLETQTEQLPANPPTSPAPTATCGPAGTP